MVYANIRINYVEKGLIGLGPRIQQHIFMQNKCKVREGSSEKLKKSLYILIIIIMFLQCSKHAFCWLKQFFIVN